MGIMEKACQQEPDSHFWAQRFWKSESKELHGESGQGWYTFALP